MARMHSDQVRAYYLALGGIRRALAGIRQDSDDKIDHFGEPWHLNTTAEAEGLLAAAGEAGYAPAEGSAVEHVSYAVSDEEGRLNVNTSSPVGWVILPGMTESLAYSILDWQDTDESPNRDGAESSYYLRQAYPYRAKNRPVTMIWELAMIKSVTWPQFLGEDTNGNQVLDAEENDGPTRWPMDNADGVLDKGLIDFFTAYGKGKVNLNTVGVEVLSALPDIGPDAAKAIIAWRQGPDGQPFTNDDRWFHNLDELVEVPGVTEYQAELLKEYGALATTHFRIVVEASVRQGAQPCRLMAVARRAEGEVQVVWVRSIAS
jgi:type II secretory pathway component PulK